MSAEPAPRRRPVGLVLRGIGILAAAGFVALLVYGIVARAPDTTIDDALARAQAVDAPGFELGVLAPGRVPAELKAPFDRTAVDGRLRLDELRGTPVVLNFWASWCDPCRQEAPILERGWQQLGPAGVLFLGLDMQDVTEDARGFLREFAVSYPNVREAGKETARRYGVTGLPETYFIDAQGQVAAHVIGVVTPQQLRAGALAAQRGRPAATSEGGAQRRTR